MKKSTTPAREPDAPGAFRYFFREALRRLWLSKRTTFVAIGMIAMSLVILGIFLLLAENLRQSILYWQDRATMTVYLDPAATGEQTAAVRAALADSTTLTEFAFVSREEARERFRSYFEALSGVIDELDQNPFPASFVIDIPSEATTDPTLSREVGAIRALDGVDDIQFDWEWIARLRNLVHVITMVGFLIGGVLTLASAFMIANVVRLTMLLYREEIDIMRLVGATERVVRGPFLIEGILQGLVGGVLSVGVLWGLYSSARAMVNPSNALVLEYLLVTFLPWEKIAILIGGGLLAGLFGSWMSLRDYAEERALPEAGSAGS